MTKREKLVEAGYEDSIIFDNPSYDSAIIGVTTDGRVVYDYIAMIYDLMVSDSMSYEDALDFIEYNTIRSLLYCGSDAPIVMHRLQDITFDDGDHND